MIAIPYMRRLTAQRGQTGRLRQLPELGELPRSWVFALAGFALGGVPCRHAERHLAIQMGRGVVGQPSSDNVGLR